MQGIRIEKVGIIIQKGTTGYDVTENYGYDEVWVSIQVTEDR